jgi:hypothetical protein
MRLGLHGLPGRDLAVAPWPSLIAALGDGAAVVAQHVDARRDAILVCGSLEDAEGETIVAFARGGGPVLGVGGGFQALCGLGLLPGRVTALADDDRPADAHVRVEGRATPFTSAIPAGRVMSLNGATTVGLRYDTGEPEALEARGQVIFRYCDAAGGLVSPPTAIDPAQLRLSSVPLVAPRERSRLIAGVCGEAGNVVGVLAVAATIEGFGAQLLGSLRMHLHGRR